MDSGDVQRAVWRMAHEIIEANQGTEEVLLVGLQTGGVPIADALAGALNAIAGTEVPVGSLDVAFYRDDIGLRPVLPEAVTHIPWSLDGRTVVVSPGKVVSKAPWAQPRRIASSGEAPVRRP